MSGGAGRNGSVVKGSVNDAGDSPVLGTTDSRGGGVSPPPDECSRNGTSAMITLATPATAPMMPHEVSLGRRSRLGDGWLTFSPCRVMVQHGQCRIKPPPVVGPFPGLALVRALPAVSANAEPCYEHGLSCL